MVQAKKHHNPLWQWMYMRDPFNYTHSVQTASNKPNNQVDNRRQRYFDSTSYNYQQYYTHEGKLNMTNQANSTAINNWLQSYDDLTVRLTLFLLHFTVQLIILKLIYLIISELYRQKRHNTNCWASFRMHANSAIH